MSLSYSVDKVDKDGREMLTYGTKDFPIAFFDDDLVKVSVPWHWHDEFEVVIITEGRRGLFCQWRHIALCKP